MRQVSTLTFRQKVERIYYNYGKFAASHPKLMLTGAILVILIAWYPLPNAFVHSSAPYEQRRIKISQIKSNSNDDKRFIGYVQQLVIENVVISNDVDAKFFIEMAYEALSECFNLIHLIKKSEIFTKHCFKAKRLVPKFKDESLFPTYSCMLLSPIQLWNESNDAFWADGNILKTINNKNAFIREMLFGLPWAKTGLRQLYKIDSSYQINYIVTFLLNKYEKGLMDQLFLSLKAKYNLSVFEPSDTAEEITYKDWNYFESHFNLLMTYLMLILYVYFSVRKIEMVKSKIGLAFSACFTVAASLYMSLGICLYIGIVVPTLPGSEIFPYLVVIIGLENTLVVTKSVVATPVDLPVKHRIAQGLEREGWAITKNLVSEILIFSLGIFTFNPAIQEFFMLALISLSVDFFLQITFFVTVLSIDMRRIELVDIQDVQQNRLLNTMNSNISIQASSSSSSSSNINGKFSKESVYVILLKWLINKLNNLYSWLFITDNDLNSNVTINSTDRAARTHKRRVSDINTAAFMKSDGMVPVYIPRRLIFLYFWAKSRFFQKLVMITTCAWIIAIILYSIQDKSSTQSPWQQLHKFINPQDDQHLSIDWKLAAMHHWPRLANLYSINITGRRLLVLPPHRIINHLRTITSIDRGRLHNNNNNHSHTESYYSSYTGYHHWLSYSNDQLIPSSLRGWANLELTVKMVLASIVGVGIVLMSTVLIMTLLQALQIFSGGDNNREPILRILPLRIDSEFSVPPGVTCLSVGKLVLAAGLEIESPEKVCSKVKSWSIETGESFDMKEKFGVWYMLFVDESRLLVSLSSGFVELWIREPSKLKPPTLSQLRECDVLQLDEGGIVRMKIWHNMTVIGVSVRGSIVILEVVQNKLQVIQVNRICIGESIKNFFITTHDCCTKIVLHTHKCVMVASLPELVVEREFEFDFLTVLSCHLSQDLLVISLNNYEFHMIDLLNYTTSDQFSWVHSAPIHWIRCLPHPINNNSSLSLNHIKRNKNPPIIVTFDMEGSICLWKQKRKYPFRQIMISAPSLIYPGPITVLDNKGNLIFADHGYLRLFNVHQNKYIRSIQILGLRDIDINEVLISNTTNFTYSSQQQHESTNSVHQWIVFLNCKREIFVLPMSTIL